jgi:hypothetical protein
LMDALRVQKRQLRCRTQKGWCIIWWPRKW